MHVCVPVHASHWPPHQYLAHHDSPLSNSWFHLQRGLYPLISRLCVILCSDHTGGTRIWLIYVRISIVTRFHKRKVWGGIQSKSIIWIYYIYQWKLFRYLVFLLILIYFKGKLFYLAIWISFLHLLYFWSQIPYNQQEIFRRAFPLYPLPLALLLHYVQQLHRFRIYVYPLPMLNFLLSTFRIHLSYLSF